MEIVEEVLLEEGSYLRNKISDLVIAYKRTHDHEKIGRPSALVTISVLLNKEYFCKKIKVALSSSMFDLKKRLEYFSAGRYLFTSLYNIRTNKSFSAFDRHTALFDCGICNDDILLANIKTLNMIGESRVKASGVAANSSFQHCVLVLHAFMLDAGFTHVIDVHNAKQNFHPVCKGQVILLVFSQW